MLSRLADYLLSDRFADLLLPVAFGVGLAMYALAAFAFLTA